MSTTEYSPAIYTGSPEQVILDAIAAKANGHLNDEQFNMVLASAHPIPIRTAHVRPIAPPEPVMTSRRPAIRLPDWHPLWQTLLVIAGLAVGGLTVWAAIVIGAAGVTAIQANALKIGVGVVCVFIAWVIFKVLSVKDRDSQARLYEARRPQRHDTRGDDR